jgi:hypothetical protein
MVAMDRYGINFSLPSFAVMLAAAITIFHSNGAAAERMNPFIVQASPATERKSSFAEQESSYVEQESYNEYCDCDECTQGEPACSCDDGCCGDGYCDDVYCGDPVGYQPRHWHAGFYAGFEATFVKPRFSDNSAFTLMEADGASFESFTDTQFNYDLEFTPRVFIGWQQSSNLGLRATWWQFDHSAANASASPPANGFGSIDPPSFGTIDLSTNIPTDAYAAASNLNAYTIDIEATKQSSFCGWDLGVGCGIRYANAEQSYNAQLRDANNGLRGQIDFQHSLEGFGPTISLDAYRPIGYQFSIFCKARGSILFGDGESQLIAGEDLDLTTPLNTTHSTSRDDLLSIGEIQLGSRWQGRKVRGRSYRPFCSIAMEGQIWNGAGTATSEDGTLGFFGFNAGAGVSW